MVVLLTAAAFTVVTGVVVVVLALAAGRRQAVTASEWWIPLFLKAGGAAAFGAGAGTLATEYVAWSVQDREIVQIVRQSSVRSEHRESDRTVYQFNPPAVGGGWSMLIRYDFEVVWEFIAAMAAVAGVLGGVLSIAIARLTMRVLRKPPGFPIHN